MLQRVQSIFLLLICLSMVALFFVPIWAKVDPLTGQSYTIYAWHLKAINPIENQTDLVVKPYIFIGVLAVAIMLVAFYALLRYDNRLRQLQLCALNSLLMAGMMGLVVYLVTKNAPVLGQVPGRYKIGFIIGMVALISNLIANQFIKRDEQMVRDTERIR